MLTFEEILDSDEIAPFKDKIELIFSKGGLMSRFFPKYKPRLPQIKMCVYSLYSLLIGKHGLIEAGTGTGKSFGYSIAAALYAMEYNETVVMTTYTLALQNQLVMNDLPIVNKVMTDLYGQTLKYQLAMGKSHYLCKRRLSEYANDKEENNPVEKQEALELTKRYIPLAYAEQVEGVSKELWKKINVDSSCKKEDSPFYGSCFFHESRRRIKDAQIIVCNYAIFFLDIAQKSKGMPGLLPLYDVAVFDEGHRIDEVFSQYYQRSITYHSISSLFDRLIFKRERWMKTTTYKEKEITPIPEHFIKKVKNYKNKVLNMVSVIFQQIAEEMIKHNKKSYLINGPIITNNRNLVHLFNDYLNAIKIFKNETTWPTSIRFGFKNYIEDIEKQNEDLSNLLMYRDPDEWAYWVEYQDNEELLKEKRITVLAAPIEGRSVFSDSLFGDIKTIITSATLTTNNNFNFISTRLGIDKNYIGVQIESPFDYEKQSHLIVPKSAPSPSSDDFQKYVNESCQYILGVTKGKTFLLFTSFTQLNETYEALKPFCEEYNITMIRQGPGVDRNAMIKTFKEVDRAVLFGAESFWEGIDIPGDDLVCVVMVRIPFPVPTDPIIEARSNVLKAQGFHPFFDYMLPLAILKLQQGYGRLIRTVSDKGVVICLDNRIYTKHYGKAILESLPNAPLKHRLTDIETVFKDAF